MPRYLLGYEMAFLWWKKSTCLSMLISLSIPFYTLLAWTCKILACLAQVTEPRGTG